MSKTLIIAEAGVNHNGDIELAKKLVDVAAEAGADYVKFQTFKAEKLVSKSAAQADYQQTNIGKEDGTQYEMLKKLELDVDKHHTLITYCNEKGISFLSTAFDLDSIDLLDSLGINLYKVSSGDITNRPYLEKIATKNKSVVLSTGMSDMSDINNALDILEKGGLNMDMITVLHCNTEYPTPMSDVNLSAMNTIGEAFKVKIGYSDHTLGIEIPIAAVARGARVIEKHFTLDRNMEGPDHRASLEPAELIEMVRSIRNIEKAMGNGIKRPSNSESKNVEIVRKSIHLSKDINEGCVLQENDLIMKRPANGISPMDYVKIIGRKVNKFLPCGAQLKWSDLV